MPAIYAAPPKLPEIISSILYRWHCQKPGTTQPRGGIANYLMEALPGQMVPERNRTRSCNWAVPLLVLQYFITDDMRIFSGEM